LANGGNTGLQYASCGAAPAGMKQCNSATGWLDNGDRDAVGYSDREHQSGRAADVSVSWTCQLDTLSSSAMNQECVSMHLSGEDNGGCIERVA
jgi:hypothetical protein